MREDLQQIGKEWLKSIPSNWKIDRLKDVCEKVVGGGTPKSSISEYWDGGDITWISPTDFSAQNGNKFITNSAKKITELGMQKSSATLIPKGTVVMSSRASIGEPKIAGCDITTNQGFVSYVPSFKIDSNFLFYLIEGQLGEYFAKIASGTTFMEITRRQAKHEHIPLPPLPEQKAIANYLDKACERIDKIIEIKQKQLEKIEGYYISIRHHLFTQGIKNSNFITCDDDFLKDIPSHWKLHKLRYILNLKNGKLITNEELVDDGKYPVYGGNGIMGRTDKYNYEGELITLGRVGAKCGNVHFTNEKVWVSDNAIAVKSVYDTSYLYHLLIVLDLHRLASETAQPLLVGNNVKNLHVAIPPLNEQKDILEKISKIELHANNLKDKLNSQITTLKSYRKSLIHECVTGKKQVWAGAIENVN